MGSSSERHIGPARAIMVHDSHGTAVESERLRKALMINAVRRVLIYARQQGEDKQHYDR